MGVVASIAMDAQQALADLAEISSQIEAAAVMDASGAVIATTLADAGRTEVLARLAARLVADAVQTGAGGELAQLEAATADGSVFVVRDGGRSIVALTRPNPTVGLVFYDLKSALRSVAPAGSAA